MLQGQILLNKLNSKETAKRTSKNRKKEPILRLNKMKCQGVKITTEFNSQAMVTIILIWLVDRMQHMFRCQIQEHYSLVQVEDQRHLKARINSQDSLSNLQMSTPITLDWVTTQLVELTKLTQRLIKMLVTTQSFRRTMVSWEGTNKRFKIVH
jgi:hypothetical protein